MSILIYDLETDGVNPESAKLKWFGAWSSKHRAYFTIPHTQNLQILGLIQSHDVLVGYNNKFFDNPILEREGYCLDKKLVIDLLETVRESGNNAKGRYAKKKLLHLGIRPSSFKLRDVAIACGLSVHKGDIDYDIFKKDNWTGAEEKEIIKYLKLDLAVTRELFDFLDQKYSPLKKYLPANDVARFKHITASIGSLSYSILCKKANIPLEWGEYEPNKEQIEGGHHITPRWKMARGNILSLDFTSAYPHAFMMANLYSHNCDCCNDDAYSGDKLFSLSGRYCTKRRGKIECAIQSIFAERMKAKSEGDEGLSLMLKLIINSMYGLSGSTKFKSLYHPNTPRDCTQIVRTMLRRMAAILNCNGVIPLYGFTDSIHVLVPPWMDEETLQCIVSCAIERIKMSLPFPVDTFKMPVEKRMKFVWYCKEKNCYLWVDAENVLGFRSTLLPSNAPRLSHEVFDRFIRPRILEELSVNFTKDEITKWIEQCLQEDLSLSYVEFKVKSCDDYSNDSSIQAQISAKYGRGVHHLIPNKKCGVGRAGKYCTLEDFKASKLKPSDVDVSRTLRSLNIFCNVDGQSIEFIDGVEVVRPASGMVSQPLTSSGYTTARTKIIDGGIIK